MNPNENLAWFQTGKPHRKLKIRNPDKANIHPALVHDASQYRYTFQVLVTESLRDWMNDARMRVAENLGVSYHRIPTSIILEACLNAFLRDYRDFDDNTWRQLHDIRRQMRGDFKKRYIVKIASWQEEAMDECAEFLRYEYENYGGRGAVAIFSLLYWINVLDPRWS